MSNQKVIDKGIKLCQLIDYARHRSRIPGARRVWPCNLTLQRPAWYGSFPPTQDWSLARRTAPVSLSDGERHVEGAPPIAAPQSTSRRCNSSRLISQISSKISRVR